MRIGSIVLSSFVLVAAALTGACTESPTGDVASNETAVTFPLVQQRDGNIYRLSARFEITSPDGTVQVVDGTSDETDVTVALIPGTNRIRLIDGWTLSRSTDMGMTFAPVSALLASQNPVNLILSPNQTSFWEFDFIVRDATNQLHITFGVDDAPRQASMDLFINGGFGDFSVYRNEEVQLDAYFTGFPQQSVDPDGSHVLTLFAGSNAIDLFGDNHGLLTPLAKAFNGGSLQITARIHPDGTQDVSADYSGFGEQFVQLQIGAGQAFLTADENGFPVDQGLFAFSMPFVLSGNAGVLVSGSVSFLDVQR
jgi:hypothetical protein